MGKVSHSVESALRPEFFSGDNHVFVDGWYRYYQGLLTGPHLASEIFLDKNGGYVARKGFRRWHEMHLLSEIYRRQITTVKPTLKTTHLPPVVTLEQPINTHPLFKPSCTLEYGNLITKGRLRLGVSYTNYYAWIEFILTLGLSSYFWYQKAMTEVLYHLDDPLRSLSRESDYYALVPLLHIRQYYRLAIIILQMEVQNNYQKTKPLLAAILAIFPPFAQIYLQKSLNTHWLKHIAHAKTMGLF